jgi:plastocyanin
MEQQAFVPQQITVAAGETVTWVNDSSQTHTVTAYQDSLPEGAPYFASGDLPSEQAARADIAAGLVRPGERFSFTFEVAGTYRYFCIPHEGQGMTGTVVVEP